MSNIASNSELDALISMLDEPDLNAFEAIQRRIEAYGDAAIPLLEDAWENAFNPVVQQRSETLIHGIQFDTLKLDLKLWCNSDVPDLLKGATLVSRYRFPSLDEEELIRKIGLISQDVWLELNHNLTGLEKIKVLNHIFFDIHKIKGLKADKDNPESNYLKQLLDSRRGSPVSIGILYIIIAQSLQIPIYGVNLPRHFVLAYLDATLFQHEDLSNQEVLFYINPFNRGAVFTQNEIKLYIRQLGIPEDVSQTKPCSSIELIARLLEELANGYKRAGSGTKQEEVLMLLEVVRGR